MDAAGLGMLGVPAAGPGACDVCRDPLRPGFARCRHCAAQAAGLPLRADVVAPIALAVRGGALAEELWRYKVDGLERRPGRLQALLAEYLIGHERCLATAAGVPGFPAVTAVPSARERSAHPLVAMARAIPGLSSRLVPFARASGEPVLLLDDTWTTGWHAQYAAGALKRAGATAVAVVVIGRSLRCPPPGWPAWSPQGCAVHREPASGAGDAPRRAGAVAAGRAVVRR